MKKSVEKFVKYLEEERRTIEKSKPMVKFVSLGKNITDIKFTNYTPKKTNAELEIDFILPRITMIDKEYVSHMELFYHFKELSKYIESADLTYQEKFDIVMFILERNIKCLAKVQQTTGINNAELKKFKFPGISSKEIDTLVSSGEISRIINGTDEELTDNEIKIRDAVLNNMEQYSTDIEDTMKQHTNIKEHYFDKEETFDTEDINIIVDSLKKLAISDKICRIMHQTLNSLLRNRKEVVSTTSGV